MNSTSLEQRLEEWAIWVVHGGACPENLGYSSVAPGFSDTTGRRQGYQLSLSRQEEVEAAVMRLRVEGHGIYDSVRDKWINRPVKRYAQCAEVLVAEYRAHRAYGDARYEAPGNATAPTLHRLGISRRTYFRKLDDAKTFIKERLEVWGA